MADTVVRSIAFPIKWPVDQEKQKTLRELLERSWKLATAESQRALRMCISQDAYVRQHTDQKLPKCPKIYTYSKGQYDGWASTASAVCRAVEKRWKAMRYDVLWTNKMGIPSYRYPQPWPIHNREWSIVDCQSRLVVKVPLGTERGIELECKLGAGQRRNLDAMRRVATGDYKPGEASVYKRKDGTVMAKFAVHIPVRTRELDGTLRVYSDAHAFLVAENDTANRLWVLNATHVREWIAKHDAALQRSREDLKASRRLRMSGRDGFLAAKQTKIDKHNRRIDSFVHEASMQLVKYAIARKFSELAIDLSDQSYFRHFPWFVFEQRIKDKATMEGLRVVKWSRNPEGCSQVATV